MDLVEEATDMSQRATTIPLGEHEISRVGCIMGIEGQSASLQESSCTGMMGFPLFIHS